MANVYIKGDAAIITSTVTLENLKNVTKYAPKALTLLGGDDGKEPVFCVTVGKTGSGAINGYGATFAPATRDHEGKATITLMVPACVEKAKEWVVNELGGALMNLKAIEEKLPEVIAKIAADKKAVEDSIQE